MVRTLPLAPDFADTKARELDGRRVLTSVQAEQAGSTGLAGSLVLAAARGIWLDAANTVKLPGYTRIDGRASYPLGGLRLSLEVFNLLDRAYSTTGFPDPAGTGAIYYYPAAGRTLQIALSIGW